MAIDMLFGFILASAILREHQLKARRQASLQIIF